MQFTRRLKYIFVFNISIMLVLSLVAGCTPQQEAAPEPAPAPALAPKSEPKPAPAPAPKSEPKPAPAPTPAPAPAIGPSPSQTQPTQKPIGPLKVKWLGQATFLITSSTGIKIITDPYTPSSRLSYGEIGESADVVTVSHNHSDHNNISAVGGNPEVIKGTTDTRDIKFKGIASFHDESQGKKRGNNTIICFEVDGMIICHLGDLGHSLNDEQIAAIGEVDILLIPVGGYYTIDATVATLVGDQLKPSVVIPMHYQTDKTSLSISGVDEFLQGKENVVQLDTSEVEFRSGELPQSAEIIVLKTAR